jgi:hypothetical protein
LSPKLALFPQNTETGLKSQKVQNIYYCEREDSKSENTFGYEKERKKKKKPKYVALKML